MSRARKTDANHAKVRDELRDLGLEVEDTSHIGGGFPDLVVYAKPLDQLFLLEVKDGDKPPSARKLTPAQKLFIARFPPVRVVLSTDDALAQMGLERVDNASCQRAQP